ncbi:hypothetical protein [Rhodanobacter denitrificans]|uniref:Uncharacterized protein n=1 Tax=Rhodanobacter denitrificans TaxID=666685 RepID=M4NJP3_9GAMM|nr:hypothetical protein [Rhodanobacter denitrificans]AGG89908.1 hypothetical protein R2APBS1_2831 [Rhodanobacter denitrificans]UJM85304.1 hypothetical protein LRJ86_10990 [Rhodanobacter denitrificans]
MNFIHLAFAVFFWLLGGWLIPTKLGAATSPLAPYRAIRGVFYLLIGLGFWLAAIGFRVAVVIAP